GSAGARASRGRERGTGPDASLHGAGGARSREDPRGGGESAHADRGALAPRRVAGAPPGLVTGRLFGVGISGPELTPAERRILDLHPPRGVILFRRNI